MEYNEYIESKNQIGGTIPSYTAAYSPFSKSGYNTAAYIFTRDTDGTFYFGFVRKLASGGRIRLNRTQNNGAAGTKNIYWGKWTSIGGGKKKYKDGTYPSHLRAVISELNDETGKKNFFRSELVDLSGLNKRFRKPNNYNLIARKLFIENNTAIFIFEISNCSLFFNIFPKKGITHPNLLTSSSGEIDAIQSYTTEQIINLQNSINNKNNYFISYCIYNFFHVMIYMKEMYKSYNKRWQNNPIINIENDTRDRINWELIHAPYREIRCGIYVF